MSIAVRRGEFFVDEFADQMKDRMRTATVLALVFGLSAMAALFDTVTMLKRW